jgi:splicing factor 45
MGKIVGGKKSKKAEEEEGGKFGEMSEVIVLRGMLRGMDVQRELEEGDGDGGLMQEIGEECGEKVRFYLSYPLAFHYHFVVRVLALVG